MGIVLINLGIYIKVIKIYVRLNSIFSDIFRDNKGNNTILSIVEKAVYNNSEDIRILSKINKFNNNINKSYNNIT